MHTQPLVLGVWVHSSFGHNLAWLGVSCLVITLQCVVVKEARVDFDLGGDF
jgi:hypothetical protein